MLRFIGSFFGAIFTAVTLGILFAALSIGGIFYMYSRDLPSHESLAQYTPPTISRIYSGEGRIIDEFAHERRLFVPTEDIPDLVKQAEQAFRKWGMGAVFIGHFFGPLRPVIFLFAGMMKMGILSFMAVNTLAAVAWAWAIPKLGQASGMAIGELWRALGL